MNNTQCLFPAGVRATNRFPAPIFLSAIRRTYLWRLAQVHGVSLQAIKTYALEGSKMTRAKATAKRADLPSIVNGRLRSALPPLTLVPDSGRLGLGGMYGRLGQNFVLRKKRCWCSACIAEMGPANRYWPLVWNLEGYSYCSRHRMPVATRCPSCSRRFDLTSDWLPFDGACPNCKTDVCQASADGAQGESSAGEIALSSALEQFSAEVANIPAVTKPGQDFALNRMRAEGESLVAAVVARKLNRFGEHRYFMQAFQLALERSA